MHREVQEWVRAALSHRSIREFTGDPVSDEDIALLREVAARTASSMGLQQASIVRVTDPEKKRQITEVAGQEYVARAPELWIYLVDIYRNTQIASEKGLETSAALGMDYFFQGFTDAALMAQNVNSAIEALGMGAVFIGNILNDPMRIVEILELPAGTFPVVGQLFGHPNQQPDRKPRMPMQFRFFENRYQRPDSYTAALQDYDREMNQYYDLRNANRRVDTFTDQVVKRLSGENEMRQRMLDWIEENGFLLRREADREGEQEG